MDFIKPFFEGKHRLAQVLFLLLFIIVGGVVFTGLGNLICMGLYHTPHYIESSNPAAYIRISQAFSSIGTFLLPALLFAYCQNKKWLDYNDANKKPYYLLVNVTLVLSIVLLPLVALISQWNQAIKLPDSMASIEQAMMELESAAQSLLSFLTVDHSYSTLVANLFVLGLLPAVCEEFLFQGTVQAFITKSSGKPHLAIWLTALIFSIIHFQFYGFIPRLLLGAYLGYLFFWSRSLWLPILAHFLHNALSIMIDFTFAGRGIMLDEVKYTQVKGSLPLTITCVLVTAMSLTFMWRIQKDLNK